MKTIYTLMLAIFSFAAINAQSISEEAVSMSLGKQNAFVVEIDGADEDMVKDVWKKFFKDYGKVKRNKKAKEHYSMAATVPAIGGSDNIDVYAKFEERVGLTNVYLWVDTGSGFVESNENPKMALGAEDFLTDFYLAVKNKAITEEMKQEEKQLKKYTKELEKLEKKNKGYHEDIEKAKRKIEEAEKNIEQNLKDQEDQRMVIEKQKKIVEEVIARLNNLGKN